MVYLLLPLTVRYYNIVCNYFVRCNFCRLGKCQDLSVLQALNFVRETDCGW